MVSSAGQGLSDNLIFTAPVAATYALTSSFIGAQRGIGVLVSVLENGNYQFNSSVTSFGQVVSFDDSFAMSAGDTLEFAVQEGGGLQNTGLDVSIATVGGVPEPAAWTMMLIGIGAIGAAMRSRRGRTGLA